MIYTPTVNPVLAHQCPSSGLHGRQNRHRHIPKEIAMKSRKHARMGMRLFCAVLVALMLGLSGCGNSGGGGSGSGTASGSAQ
jgi:hypothetical protein